MFHEENEDSKVHKGFLYEEKKECFARRKRRFEGSQRFFSSCRFMRLRVLFKNISPSCGGRFMRRRRNVSHEENEDLKVYKGFLFVPMGLRVLFQKHKRFLRGRFMRRRRNVSHEENEDSKVYKGFSLRAVSWGLWYYFKNTSPSCGGRFMRRRRSVSHKENEDSKVHKGFLFVQFHVARYYYKNTSPSCRRFRRRRRRNVSHKENEDSKVYKRFEGLQRFLLQPQFLPHRFDTSSISR
jgi:uncharacterized protein YbbK (DUF523 family)